MGEKLEKVFSLLARLPLHHDRLAHCPDYRPVSVHLMLKFSVTEQDRDNC